MLTTTADSRPDYAAQSTDDRMARSVKGGLGFIQTYISPEVIITGRMDWEDSFFWADLSVICGKLALPTLLFQPPRGISCGWPQLIVVL